MVAYKPLKELRDVHLARFDRRYPELFGVLVTDPKIKIKEE